MVDPMSLCAALSSDRHQQSAKRARLRIPQLAIQSAERAAVEAGSVCEAPSTETGGTPIRANPGDNSIDCG